MMPIKTALTAIPTTAPTNIGGRGLGGSRLVNCSAVYGHRHGSEPQAVQPSGNIPRAIAHLTFPVPLQVWQTSQT
jgi:hypothetical protein